MHTAEILKIKEERDAQITKVTQLEKLVAGLSQRLKQLELDTSISTPNVILEVDSEEELKDPEPQAEDIKAGMSFRSTLTNDDTPPKMTAKPTVSIPSTALFSPNDISAHLYAVRLEGNKTKLVKLRYKDKFGRQSSAETFVNERDKKRKFQNFFHWYSCVMYHDNLFQHKNASVECRIVKADIQALTFDVVVRQEAPTWRADMNIVHVPS